MKKQFNIQLFAIPLYREPLFLAPATIAKRRAPAQGILWVLMKARSQRQQPGVVRAGVGVGYGHRSAVGGVSHWHTRKHRRIPANQLQPNQLRKMRKVTYFSELAIVLRFRALLPAGRIQQKVEKPHGHDAIVVLPRLHRVLHDDYLLK